MPQQRTVLITGVSGNLGTRLLPMLPDFRVIGVDVCPPDVPAEMRFEEMDLGREACCMQMIDLLRETEPTAVIHLAFVLDPLRAGVLDIEKMWQINVAGTARIMEAISVVNRTGGHIQRFIFPSSVSVYGPDTPGPVKEDFPLRAHTLPYAVHKRESDEVVRYRAESMGDCATYILRPHIYTGASMQNYMVGALRGTPLGKSKRAASMRAAGKRLPFMLPRGEQYPRQKLQFVHVDDVARLVRYLLDRADNDAKVHVLNVTGRGEAVTLQQCAEIAHMQIKRVPTKAACGAILRVLWKLGISSIPPAALPYMIGSYTMDTSRLQELLGPDYQKVIHYTNTEALQDCFTSAPDLS
jgi:nucleoside-diphosphate-sugar epimerase